MISITVTDECNPKATFLLLNAWDPFRSYVNQRVPIRPPSVQRASLPMDVKFRGKISNNRLKGTR